MVHLMVHFGDFAHFTKCTNRMKLNISTINALQIKRKSYKITDGRGLFLLVHSNGSKYWRMNYRFQGKQKTIALGVFGKGKDFVSLAEARDKAQEIRKQIKDGIDPSEARKQEKIQNKNSFANIALEWIEKKSNKWTAHHAKDVRHTLERDIFPYIGNEPIDKITTQNLISVLRKIEKRGSLEVLRKLRQRCNNIFIYAKVSGYVQYNPAEGLEEVLQNPTRDKNFNSIEISELPALVKAIKTYPSLEPTTRTGLLLALYTFQRTNDIRGALWNEFDLENAIWSIPASRHKMKRDQLVPLPKQAIEALEALKPITGHFPFVFASTHKPHKQPMSENAMLYALYRMNFKDKMTVHGFRHLGSTVLNEMGYDSRWIEKQLSHEDKNAVRGAYNKAKYFPERVKMMQEYADFVDRADGSNIVPIGHLKNKQ